MKIGENGESWTPMDATIFIAEPYKVNYPKWLQTCWKWKISEWCP
jgi:hypothetical protein